MFNASGKRFLRTAIMALCLLFAGAAAFTLVEARSVSDHGLGSFEKTISNEGFLELVFSSGKMRVSERGGMLHIKATDDRFSSFESFSVVSGQEPESAPEFSEKPEHIEVETGKLRAVIDKSDGTMEVLDLDGNLIVSEPAGGGAYFEGDTVGCTKRMPADEHYYGFGEKTGSLDKRGERMVMWNKDAMYNDEGDPLYQSHPFYMALQDGRAYGLFFDNTFRSVFDVGFSRPGALSFSAESGELDYWIVPGPTPADVLSGYGDLVGTMPLPPLWGLGHHQCRWSYKTAERVREIRDGYQRHDIPLDAVYLDIHYMRDYRVFTFDKERFPDPEGLIEELRQDGVKTVVIVDPGIKIDEGYKPYEEGIEDGYFVLNPDGEPFTARVWPGAVHFPDFYQKEARDWWADWHSFYTDKGVAGIWNDMNEPAGWAKDIPLLGYRIPMGTPQWRRMRHGGPDELVPHARIHNVYANLENQATWEGLIKERPNERPFIISRAGFPGIQRTSLIWTGDNFSTWSSMRVSVPMQLNMGLSGLAFVGSDVGGFGGWPTPNLYARWIELGVFYPFDRIHTSNSMPDQEPWEFGDKVTDISRKMIKLRYRLLPYTYTVFEESHRKNAPVMRAMVYEFPADEAVSDMSDQFMWGKWLLVAPVLEGLARSKEVYFPEGGWYDFFTGKKYEGPATVEVDAPLGKLPLFAREGAIIPLAPEMNHVTEKPWEPLTVLVFPGEEASSFTLYEDDKESMDYKEGEWSRTTFECLPLDNGWKVRINAPEGTFDPDRKRIKVVIHGVSRTADTYIEIPCGKESVQPEGSYDAERGAWVFELPAAKCDGHAIRIEEG
ncbi:MAG: glycoside hydrolase family 31 protein [bacterium]